MKKQLKRMTCSMVMIALLAATFIAVFPGQSLAKSGKKYSLPSRITVFKYKNGSYKKKETIKLYYNKKGYLKSDSWGNKYHYKYRKNGKLKKMTEIYGSYPNEPHTFDKKGRITGLGNIDLGTFKHYYNKKGYLQRVREHDPECDVTYEYTFDSKKRIRGIKEKTLIVDAKDGFDCYYTLDKKGFVTKVACQRVNDNGKEYPVTYNISYKKDSKKRIKSIIIKRVENGKKIKIVFKYKKAKTKNFKYYRAIINRCAPQYAYDGVYFPRNIEAFP